VKSLAADKEAIGTVFYGPVTEAITLAGNIISGGNAEPISMQGADYIPKGINKAIGKQAAGMRTFIRKGK
jgi:hypothetical protein